VDWSGSSTHVSILPVKYYLFPESSNNNIDNHRLGAAWIEKGARI